MTTDRRSLIELRTVLRYPARSHFNRVHPRITPGSIDIVDVTFIYMMFVLKIPIIALLWIVWWAIHQTPEPQEATGHDDGGTKPTPHPRSPLPHPPRRGPHGDPPAPAPARVRTPARGRTASRD